MNNGHVILDVQQLSFDIKGQQVLNSVSFQINRGETVGLVGESGSGKSMTAKAILGFLPSATGKIAFQDKNLLDASKKEIGAIRGNNIAFICQNPMTSLNPTLSIGTQLTEGIIHHQTLSKKEANEKAASLLHKMGMSDPQMTLKQFPDQLSGGMRQRAVIAMALMCDPSLLIADEPTTSLDVTTQAQILDLLEKVQQDTKMSILLITHDLGVVAGSCKHIYVIKTGQIVDHGTPEHIFYESANTYTRDLCWKRL